MAQETNHSQAPMLCSAGCGFYGNPRTHGLCSVCYKEHLQQQNSSGRGGPPEGEGERPWRHREGAAALLHPVVLPLMRGPGLNPVFQRPHCLPTSEPVLGAGDRPSLAQRPVAAPVGSLSDALPVPCSDGGMAAAQPDPTSPSAQPSPVSAPSLLSESSVSSPGESTSVDKAAPEPQHLAASVSELAQQPAEEQSRSLGKPKQKKNRCFMCRKKVGLTGFQCRCGNVYCSVHRYSDAHDCSYNYKADAAEKIRKENPVVVGEKIQKI